jgi:hypothetical protein
MLKFLSSVSSLFFISLFGFATSFAAGPQVADFPYSKQVLLPNVTTQPSLMGVSLGREMLNAINEKFSNINLFNDKNEEIDFEIFYDEFSRLKQENIRISDISSQKNNPPKSLIDGDPFTTYTFDERVDGRDDSWVLLDLGKPYPFVRLKIFKPDRSQIRFVQVQGGLTPDTLKTIVSKRPFSWQLDFNSDEVRYLKISLWGVGVKVDDIKLYKGESAELYFSAEQGDSYQLLYGGNTNRIRYKKRFGEPQMVLSWANLSREIKNPLFPKDWDGDGYDNQNDNCPFISNPLQRDDDDDRVGNDCDNALDVKNFNQYDTDYDDVGDVIDNCKLIPNPDQKDRDNDGYGNACDSAHAVEETPQTMMQKFLFSCGIAFLILLGIFLWKTNRGKKLLKIKK